MSSRYPSDTWNHLFCFLTPDGRAGSTQGTDEWQSLSFGKLLQTFEIAIKDDGLSGEGAKLFDYYHTMMKRHDIVQDSSDPELDEAVLAVWAKHKETLDFLLAHRPDPFSDVLRELDEHQTAISDRLENKCDEKIQADSKLARYRRFSFPNFAKNCSEIYHGDTKWVSSGAQLVLELTVENEQVVVSFCVGPQSKLQGEVLEFRSRLIKELNKLTQQDKRIATGAKHYWRGSLLTWDDIEGEDQKAYLEVLEEKLAQFVKAHLDDVRQAVQAACKHQAQTN